MEILRTTPALITIIICGTILLICFFACLFDTIKTAIKEKTARVLDEQKYFYSNLTPNDIRQLAGIPTVELMTEEQYNKIFPDVQKKPTEAETKTKSAAPDFPPVSKIETRPLNAKYH